MRTVTVLLGEPIRESLLNRDDVFSYSFASREPSNQIIVESEYLTPEQSRVANDHMAEFSAWHVLATRNPLNLDDHDVIAMTSSRKFEDTTKFGLEEFVGLLPTFSQYLPDGIGIVRAYPDRPLERDRTSFFHHGHFNATNCRKLAETNGLRSDFTTYCPLWRNYFVGRFDVLKNFVAWINMKLVPILFEDGWRPRTDVIESIRPDSTSYNPYRVFGLFLEFFHQLYFAESGKLLTVFDRNAAPYCIEYAPDLSWHVVSLPAKYPAPVKERSDISEPASEQLMDQGLNLTA